jgi:site-specific recombinase XerD
LRAYSTRRIRQIIRAYAVSAWIRKRVYPHLFRHQIITFLTKKGIISPKLQLLSGHSEEKSLAIYRDLALADVSPEYQEGYEGVPGTMTLLRAIAASLV